MDVVFLAYYEAEKRYLFPFSRDAGYCPAYTYVTHVQNDLVCEAYMMTDSQIVYDQYETINAEQTAYAYINYVPNGTYPVWEYMEGIFQFGSGIEFIPSRQTTWLDERNGREES